MVTLNHLLANTACAKAIATMWAFGRRKVQQAYWLVGCSGARESGVPEQGGRCSCFQPADSLNQHPQPWLSKLHTTEEEEEIRSSQVSWCLVRIWVSGSRLLIQAQPELTLTFAKHVRHPHGWRSRLVKLRSWAMSFEVQPDEHVWQKRPGTQDCSCSCTEA